MRDPYEVLGVARAASDADIKSAYRILAKKFHPDVDPGKADQFKEVTAAYEFLKDPDRRRRFDRGEVNAAGMSTRARPRHTTRPADMSGFGADPLGRDDKHGMNGGYGDMDSEAVRSRYQEIFSDFFAGLKTKDGQDAPKTGPSSSGKAGSDQSFRLKIAFEEAARGAKRRLRLGDERRVDVRIPAGVHEGQQIRLKGMGRVVDGRQGDALITIEIEPHAYFERRDNDVLLSLPVSLVEAVLGAKIKVPTISGPVQLTIPPGSNTGTTLRLKGRGIKPEKAPGASDAPAGDQLVTLQIALPDDPPKDFVKTVKKWSERWTGSVRDHFGLE